MSYTCRAEDDIAQAVGKQVKEGSSFLPDQCSIACDLRIDGNRSLPSVTSPACAPQVSICVDGDDGAERYDVCGGPSRTAVMTVAFIYRCPNTGLNVQGWVAEEAGCI